MTVGLTASTASTPFTKAHGLGNDFIVVDLRDPQVAAQQPSVESPEAARLLCDRRFGVGGDGVLAILPPVTPGADARMRVLNADGSEAEMCGNGIRCVAKYLFDRDPTLRKPSLLIDTGAGPLACGITPGADGTAAWVSVAMGLPRLRRAEIPLAGAADERCVEELLVPGGQRWTCVSMGNPHAITFVADSGAALRTAAESIGPGVETHPVFPRRTNVELARVVSPTEIELVVWERGCGITLACGTGACATVVAACLTGRAQVGAEVTVRLLGGPLAITVAPDYAEVTMRGPATLVYDASVDLAALLALG